MISSISQKITSSLIRSGVIPSSEYELYSYGFFLLVSNIVFMLITMIFGAILKVIWESIIFYIMFITLRGYAGGVHAAREHTCTVCTILSLFVSILTMRLLMESGQVVIGIALLFFGTCTVLHLSPMENTKKPLTKSEYSNYKKITYRITIGVNLMALSALFLTWCGPLFISATAFTLEGILLLAGRKKEFRQREGRYNNPQ